MNKHIISIVGLLIASFGLTAAAQVVSQADQATLQPLIRRDAEGFLSCGIRAIVLTSDSKSFEAYDFSVSADAGLVAGLVKSGRKTISIADAIKKKMPVDADTPAPINFWVAKETAGKALVPKKIVASEDKGFILGIADIVPTYEVLLAMVEGQRMQFAVRYKAERFDRSIAFSAKLSPPEIEGLNACISGITDRLKQKMSEQE